MARRPVDHKLVLKMIPVTFSSGNTKHARAEGNNAAWECECGEPLIGRCYYAWGDTCYTQCPGCNRTFRVTPDDAKRAIAVVEQAA